MKETHTDYSGIFSTLDTFSPS